MPIQSRIVEHNGIKYRVDVEIEPILEFNIINALKYQIKKHFNKPPKKHHHNKKSMKKNPKLVNKSNKNDDIESIASKLVDRLNKAIKESEYKDLADICAFSYTDSKEERNYANVSNNPELAFKGMLIYAYSKGKQFYSFTEYNPYDVIIKTFNSVCKEMFHNNDITYKRLNIRDKVYFVIYYTDESERELIKLADELKDDKLFNSYEYPIEYLSDWHIKNVRKVRGIVYELMSNSSFKSLVNNNTFEMLYDPYGIVINIDLLKDPSIKSYITEYLNSTQKLNKLLIDAYDEKNKDNEELWNEIRKLDDQCMDDLYAGLDKYEEDKIRKNINSLKDKKYDDFEVYTDISGGSNTSTRVTFTINF